MEAWTIHLSALEMSKQWYEQLYTYMHIHTLCLINVVHSYYLFL